MKKYKDDRISFIYPEEFKITRAKRKWGQYNLESKGGFLKGGMLVTIQIAQKDVIGNLRGVIRSRPPEEIEKFAKIEYFGSVTIGEKQGIGHVATMYDRFRKFWGKIYRYLFSLDEGGLYIEISGREDFAIDTYKEILESIKVKETVQSVISNKSV